MPTIFHYFLVPSPPTEVKISEQNNSTVHISWQAVNSTQQIGVVTGYILFYREELGLPTSYIGSPTMNLSVTLTGLKRNTKYLFRILAYNEKGNGVPTEIYSITTTYQVYTGISILVT